MMSNVVEKKCCRKILQKNNVDLSKDVEVCRSMRYVGEKGRMMWNGVE